MNYQRRTFIRGGMLSVTASLLSLKARSLHLPSDCTEAKPPIKPALIKDFVFNAHANLDKIKEMLQAEPALLNSAWDWGGGDFETALNAAGHMGRPDIAAYLLAAGARMDIFCAAMLGKIEIVRSTLTAFPDLRTSKGPHGLMLLHHARQGKENSKEVLDYLESIGAS